MAVRPWMKTIRTRRPFVAAVSVGAFALAAFHSGCSSSTAPHKPTATEALVFTPTPTSTPVPTATATATARGWAYVFGGDSGGNALTDCWGMRINNDGSVGPFVQGSPMPPAALPGGSVAGFASDGSTLYLAGGFDGFSFAQVLSSVYSANTASGSISNWLTQTALPQTRYAPVAFAGAGNLYVIGGSASATIFQAPISGQTVGAWNTVAPMPGTVDFAGIATAGSTAYVVGGFHPSPNRSASVWSATFSTSGLSGWSQISNMPVALDSMAVAVDGTMMYVVGGNDGNNYPGSSAVYSATILSGGALSTWSSEPPLPERLGFLSAFAKSGTLYALGGWRNGINVQSGIYSATRAGGSLSPWTTAGFYPYPINDHGTVVF